MCVRFFTFLSYIQTKLYYYERDLNGNHVDPYSLVDLFYKERCSTASNRTDHQLKTSDESAPLQKGTISIQGDPEEELLNSILADMDPL